jgi:hypothetical protein
LRREYGPKIFFRNSRNAGQKLPGVGCLFSYAKAGDPLLAKLLEVKGWVGQSHKADRNLCLETLQAEYPDAEFVCG